MSIENRPYVGTWRLDTKEVVRYTPDALVYFNGSLEIPGCPTCGGRIDLQQYITSVGVDPSIEPIAQANITMQIPRASTHAFFRDGQFVLTTGLEVNIYYRGYFPIKGILAGVPPEQSGGIDVSNAVMYPYYHVFHGIVTEVSHEYSGGEHTASMTCADMLHFWQNQRMATQGAVFAPKASGGKIQSSVVGHNYTGMTPYSIIYTLYRDVMGAAGGADTALSGNVTNAAADSSTYQQSMHQMTMLYWEERFGQHFNNLRMYGMDGTLYNAFQQAFLARLSTADSNKLIKQFADPTTATKEHDPEQDLQAQARAVGYDPFSVMAGPASAAAAASGSLGVNVTTMQAFVWDVGSTGNFNFWETEYQTKLDIASTLRELTGYEFYQDVDGDFVFKPPFYNLDTSSSRAYVIKDIDIISFNFQEGEPEVTAVKATAEAFSNCNMGLGGEMGKRAEFVDYRLVAKYGWRSQDFESSYLPNAQAMYYACINRMDLFNIGVKSATCQIPLRPELRPGYPIYVEYLDCFFYLQSMGHSFQFGGQCATQLNLVGRRAKWHAPGDPPTDGTEPTIRDIHLEDPWLPSLPLQVIGSDGIPRLQGFPNVVMALDPELLNPDFWAVGVDLNDLSDPAQMRALLLKALSYGVLEIDEERAEGRSGRDKRVTGPYLLREGNDVVRQIGTAQELLNQVQTYQAAQNEQNVAQNKQQARETVVNEENQSSASNAQAADVQAIIDAVASSRRTAIQGDQQAANYLDTLMDLKASFNPGKSLPGYYRYYSASHPNADQQGMKELVADDETGTTQTAGNIYLEASTKVFGFADTDEGNILTDPNDPNDPYGGVTVTAGIPIMKPNTGTRDARAVPTPTHQIATIAFAQHYMRKSVEVKRMAGQKNPSWPSKLLKAPATDWIRSSAESEGAGLTIGDRFEGIYNQLRDSIAAVQNGFQQTGDEPLDVPTFEEALATIKSKGVVVTSVVPVVPLYRDEEQGVLTLSQTLANILAESASRIFRREFDVTKSLYGVPGKNSDGGSLGATPEEKNDRFGAIDVSWADLVGRFTGGEFSGIPQVSDDGTIDITLPEFNEKNAMYSAVFPVSDHRGYEVIGTYAYGRGLSIEPGGNLEQLSNTNRFDNVSLEAVEAFLEALRENSSPSKALGLLAQSNPEAAAEIATAAFDDFSGAEVLSDLDYFSDLFNIRFRNYSSSSSEFSQKVSVKNAAYSLADMGLQSTRQICECKGAEADQLLLAFGDQGFVNVDQPDEVSAWVADQMAEEALAWRASQDALRGQVQNSRYGALSEAFHAMASGLDGVIVSGQAQLEQASLTEASQSAAEIQANLSGAFNTEEEG